MVLAGVADTEERRHQNRRRPLPHVAAVVDADTCLTAGHDLGSVWFALADPTSVGAQPDPRGLERAVLQYQAGRPGRGAKLNTKRSGLVKWQL
jgi:hypothetical protein